MTTVYILRHGKTHNPNGILYGHLPGFRLDEEGKRQIKKAAKLLARQPISVIYSSPLLRTRQSAQIFRRAFPKAKFKILKRLTEWGFGPLQGKKLLEVHRLPFDLVRKYYEPQEKVVARLRSAFKKIIEENPGQRVVVFSHAWPIIALWRSLEGRKVELPLEDFPHEQILVLKLDQDLNLLAKPKLLEFS